MPLESPPKQRAPSLVESVYTDVPIDLVVSGSVNAAFCIGYTCWDDVSILAGMSGSAWGFAGADFQPSLKISWQQSPDRFRLEDLGNQPVSSLLQDCHDLDFKKLARSQTRLHQGSRRWMFHIKIFEHGSA